MKAYKIRRHCEIMHGDKHDTRPIKRKKLKETKISGSGKLFIPRRRKFTSALTRGR